MNAKGRLEKFTRGKDKHRDHLNEIVVDHNVLVADVMNLEMRLPHNLALLRAIWVEDSEFVYVRVPGFVEGAVEDIDAAEEAS